MYRYKILKDVEVKEWNLNLQKSNYATFFQSAEYLYSHSDSKNKFPLFMYIFNTKQEIKGQLGIVVQKFPQIYSTKLMNPASKIIALLGNRASWVGGPVIHTNEPQSRKEILKKIIEGLDDIAKNNNLIMLDGYTSPQDYTIDDDYKEEFKNADYIQKIFLTYITDLSKSEEEIWNGLNKSARRDVVKAKKNNIIIKELKEGNLEEFFELSKVWAKTKGIQKTLNSIMMKKYWNYYKKGIEKIFLAYEDGELVSSHRIGCFNKIAYSHSLVNSYKKSGTSSGPFLTWYALLWAKENDMKIYDFSGGEAPKNENLNDLQYKKQWNSLLAYKRKWGGKEFPYLHFSKIMKKKSYKIMRGLLKIDWILRDYKKSQVKIEKRRVNS